MFSHEPTIHGQIEIACDEFMFVQDMLIALPGQMPRLPRQVQCFAPLVEEVMAIGVSIDYHIYLTAKRLFVSTDDHNYIWSDSFPTEFCVQPFELSDDHTMSMIQMAEQAWRKNIVTYDDKLLLGLDNTVVHRVAPVTSCGVRTFAKISISRNRYNRRGNAHNDLIDYDWPMVDRAVDRNDPAAVAP
jgi:hypothetical protein